jgi:hypothetical protein
MIKGSQTTENLKTAFTAEAKTPIAARVTNRPGKYRSWSLSSKPINVRKSGTTRFWQKIRIIRRALAISVILIVVYNITFKALPTGELEIVEAIRAIVIAGGLSWWLWWDNC